MKKRQSRKIVNDLLAEGLVYRVFPTRDALSEVVRDAKQPLRILYGETYDEYGITTDSLKYYFFLAILANNLKKIGVDSRAVVLIADRAAIMNSSAKDKTSLLMEGKKRQDLCLRIASIYKLPVEFILMSEYVVSDGFENKVQQINKAIEGSTAAVKLLEKTVLVNKIKQERDAKFRYACEAIAVASDFDIKIGPPREIFYDRAYAKVGKAYCGIYLKPTFPFGQDFLFYLQNQEIEKFGLTPYKAGSNKLQDFRIVIGKTSLSEAERLILCTDIFSNKDAANPIMDLLHVGQMAKELLTGERARHNRDPKTESIEMFREYIYQPLHEGGIYE